MAFGLFAVLSGSALWDLRTGKIPNRWLIFGAAAGAALICLRGWPPEAEVWRLAVLYFLRLLFFLILFFPLFLFRMMGAGDCKLLALVGGYLGIFDGFLVGFYGFLAAAVWSLLYMFRKKILIRRLTYFLSYITQTLDTGRITPYYDADRDGPEAAFSLAPFIWCGYVFWLLGQIGGTR